MATMSTLYTVSSFTQLSAIQGDTKKRSSPKIE